MKKAISALVVALTLSCAGAKEETVHEKKGQSVPPGRSDESQTLGTGNANIFGDRQGFYVGYCKRDKDEWSLLITNLGVETVEDGKLSDQNWQQWNLSCAYPEPSSHVRRTWCHLNVMQVLGFKSTFPVIKQLEYYSRYGQWDGEAALRDVQADWPAGKLDFKVMDPDGGYTDVEIHFHEKDKNLYLDDFKGVAAFRSFLSNTPTSHLYRVQEYSTVISVPLKMNGRRDTAEREFSKLISGLSPQDQATWAAIKADKKSRPNLNTPPLRESDVLARLKKGYPSSDWDSISSGKKEPTSEEGEVMSKVMTDYLEEKMRNWLSGTALSAGAKDAILKWFVASGAQSLAAGDVEAVNVR